jgi:hypothetical protein
MMWHAQLTHLQEVEEWDVLAAAQRPLQSARCRERGQGQGVVVVVVLVAAWEGRAH